MDRAQVVAAFSTEGEGKEERLAQVLIVRSDGARMELAGAAVAGALKQMTEFVGDGRVAASNGYEWKRLLRKALAASPAADVKKLLDLTVDVSEWSQRKFPRQRKDVASVCTRLKIELPTELVGLEREAAGLRLIVPHLDEAVEAPKQATPKAAAAPRAPKAAPKKADEPFLLRLQRAWAVLMGTA